MDKPPIVFRIVLVANNDPSKILEPGHQAFYLPPALVPSEWTSILGFGLRAVAAMWCDQLDPIGRKLLIQWIAIVSFITDQSPSWVNIRKAYYITFSGVTSSNGVGTCQSGATMYTWQQAWDTLNNALNGAGDTNNLRSAVAAFNS